MANNPYVNKVQTADGATIIDITGTTATADKILQGYGAYGADGAWMDGTATGGGGGGGASNIVTGTFKGTTTGTAIDINLSYTGSGYPIAFIVVPTGGLKENSTFDSLVQRYAVGAFFGFKDYASLSPTYTGSSDSNSMARIVYYKSNASNSTSYSANANRNTLYYDNNASSGIGTLLFVRSAKKMSVFIANTSYGFAANVEYIYYVIYSS